MSRRSQIERPVQARGVVHQLVAQTAKEMAGAVYEASCLRSNGFYALWPSIDEFVARRWTTFVQDARETLAEMLGMPDSQVSPDQKAQIHEALLLNAAVNPAYNSIEKLLN